MDVAVRVPPLPHPHDVACLNGRGDRTASMACFHEFVRRRKTAALADGALDGVHPSRVHHRRGEPRRPSTSAGSRTKCRRCLVAVGECAVKRDPL